LITPSGSSKFVTVETCQRAAPGKHPAGVEIGRDRSEAGGAAGPDVLDHGRQIVGMPVSVPRDRRPMGRSAFSA
jgi:hypothetical protein